MCILHSPLGWSYLKYGLCVFKHKIYTEDDLTSVSIYVLFNKWCTLFHIE